MPHECSPRRQLGILLADCLVWAYSSFYLLHMRNAFEHLARVWQGGRHTCDDYLFLLRDQLSPLYRLVFVSGRMIGVTLILVAYLRQSWSRKSWHSICRISCVGDGLEVVQHCPYMRLMTSYQLQWPLLTRRPVESIYKLLFFFGRMIGNGRKYSNRLLRIFYFCFDLLDPSSNCGRVLKLCNIALFPSLLLPTSSMTSSDYETL